ncbi:unnamed protein product [Gadus morhua 'NCC']
MSHPRTLRVSGGEWSSGLAWTLAFCDIHFRDSKLVVDGSILAHHLYKLANLDQNHGGEYLAFQAEVQSFFTTLDNC